VSLWFSPLYLGDILRLIRGVVNTRMVSLIRIIRRNLALKEITMQLQVKKIAIFSLLALALGLFVSQPVLPQDLDEQQAKIFQVPATVVPPQTAGVDTTQTENPAPPANSANIPVVNSPASKMTPGEKLSYGAHKAFLSPTTYIFPVFTAQRQVRSDNEPNKDTGDKFADGLTRYSINLGTSMTRNLFAFGIYPIIYRQNPRYFPSGKKGIIRRSLYAASRVFVTYGDNGETQVNYSHLSGTFTASALANIWEQSALHDDRRGVGPTFHRFRNSLLSDMLRFVIFKEFGPDIKRLILRR
jgi:hypothetical protein